MSILGFLGLTLIIMFAIAALSFAPWVPTRSRDVQRAIRLANLKPGEIFYDLWCGDGRVTFEAARAGANAIGVELFFPLYLICLLKKVFLHSQARFKCKNLFSENLSKADVIFVFGMPDALKNKLREKLDRELQPGSRVISYCFAIDGWIPEKICKWEKNNELSLFVYKK